jgi:hypothetical protein
MVARRKKKYQTGEASNYVSRKQALKKLQLNLKVTKVNQNETKQRGKVFYVYFVISVNDLTIIWANVKYIQLVNKSKYNLNV